MYLVVGEVLRVADPEFASRGGFVNFGDEIWVIRAISVALAVTQLTLTHTLFSANRGLDSEPRRRAAVDDSSLAVFLQARGLHRLAMSESVGVYGLTLYIMNAERFDLYAFCLIAFLNMMLVRPKREDWESAFRTQSIIHPTVSSSPW